MKTITPNLWFDGNAEEARDFYISVFKDAEARESTYYTEVGPGKPGTVLTASWRIFGTEFVGINGGPEFHFTEAVSFSIPCDDQEEIDYYWEKLTEGGQEVQCGWLTDKYGLSWQVVPADLERLIRDPDREKANRVMTAVLRMVKLDIAQLRAAYHGE